MEPKKRHLKFKEICFIFIFLLLLFPLKSCVANVKGDMEDIKKENAREYILDCENPYTYVSKGINGHDCDEARKFYYNYTEEEWEEEKELLIDLGYVTEEDYLYLKITGQLD